MAASYVIHRPAVVAMLDAGIEILRFFRFRLGRILTIVSKLVYKGFIKSTYIGVIIQLLSTMDTL